MKTPFYLTVFVTSAFLCTSAFAQKTILHTYYHDNAPPRYFVLNNMDTGICVDIIKELNVRLESKGISIINLGDQRVPVKRILRYLENDIEIDLFVGSAKTKKRIKAGLKFSVPIYPLYGTFAKRIDDPFVIRDTNSLRGMAIGVLRGSRSVQTMNQIEGITVVETNSMELGLKMLAVGRIDLVYYHHMGLAWQIKGYGLADKLMLVNEHEYIESAPHYIVFSKKFSNDIIAEINKVIESIQENGIIDNILEKYK